MSSKHQMIVNLPLLHQTIILLINLCNKIFIKFGKTMTNKSKASFHNRNVPPITYLQIGNCSNSQALNQTPQFRTNSSSSNQNRSNLHSSLNNFHLVQPIVEI